MSLTENSFELEPTGPTPIESKDCTVSAFYRRESIPKEIFLCINSNGKPALVNLRHGQVYNQLIDNDADFIEVRITAKFKDAI